MIHDANRCLCEDCMDYRDRVLRARRRMGLRPIPQIPPVAATRDAAAGGPTTHKEKRSAGHPTGQVVTQGDASRVGVADDLAAQLPQTPSVRVTRDTRTEGSNHPLGKAREAADPRSVRLLTESRQGDTETADPRLTVARGRHLNSEPGNDRLGQTSSAVTGEGCALDNLPQAGASGVSGPAVHRGRHVAARAAAAMEAPTVGAAS